MKASQAALETTLRRRLAVVSKSIFLKCVAVAVVLGEFAVWTYFARGALRLVAGALAVIFVLGVCVRVYLRRGVIRKPSFLIWAAVVAVVGVAVALGGLAAGIYFLHGALRWAAVVVLLGVCVAGIYLLWGLIRGPDFLTWAAVVVALCVCAVGVYLLWGVWDGSPVAAAFTRVGGATRVETSLEASRFWLTPPQCVVETQATDAGHHVRCSPVCREVTTRHCFSPPEMPSDSSWLVRGSPPGRRHPEIS